MEVIRATTRDAEVISALNYEVQHVHAEALPRIFKPASSDTFPTDLVRQLLTEPDTYMFLCYVDAEPAGYIWAQIIRRPETTVSYAAETMFIHHISVNAPNQGMGCGRALVQAVLDLANETLIPTVALDVWSFNTRAKEFFEEQGFQDYRAFMWLRHEA